MICSSKLPVAAPMCTHAMQYNITQCSLAVLYKQIDTPSYSTEYATRAVHK